MIKSSVASFLVGALTICFNRKWFIRLLISKRLKSSQMITAQLGSRASSMVKELNKHSRKQLSFAVDCLGWLNSARTMQEDPLGRRLGFR